MEWLGIAFLGILTFGIFVFLIKNSKYKLDASLFGLYTLGVFLLIVAVVQPESLKLQGLEIVRKVQSLEKSLRPYAIVDINLSDGKVKLIHQTINDGDFIWLGAGRGSSGEPEDYSFKVKTSARFVELRCENAYGSIVSKTPLADSFVKFSIKFTVITADTARCIVEAYIER